MGFKKSFAFRDWLGSIKPVISTTSLRQAATVDPEHFLLIILLISALYDGVWWSDCMGDTGKPWSRQSRLRDALACHGARKLCFEQ